ncbi:MULTISPECIES: hypothetical protein [unclassified Janthinobacterium]|jgi:hypothetical protein|uniref:hypothetical protein n=1 Tax=unclassified Janthinobacterium TaxID=2610881 RepID=UPI000C1115D7|nr:MULTISPECIES: hypothetical protein [unclassified Janthinobacterium]MDZ5636154.1 hypothetical protein [Janthinobacterium sp. GMG1]PHV24943.1 hypothetical protein CSQ93_26705 [Janthinobacterium sp. BJB426]
MPNEILSISAHCIDNPACIFTGSDMRIEVLIKNVGNGEVGYPLKYMQARGPNMRLIDNVSEQSQVLKTGLANHALKRDLTTIAPGQSIALQSVIKHTELLLFRKEFVDVTAEIGVSAGIQTAGNEETLPFKGGASLKIIGRDTLEREAQRR